MTTNTQTQTPYQCPVLPVNGYAFQFLQILKDLHNERGNFSPIPLQEILDLLPEKFQDCNIYEEIEILYDQEIVESYYNEGFFLAEKYR